MQFPIQQVNVHQISINSTLKHEFPMSSLYIRRAMLHKTIRLFPNPPNHIAYEFATGTARPWLYRPPGRGPLYSLVRPGGTSREFLSGITAFPINSVVEERLVSSCHNDSTSVISHSTHETAVGFIRMMIISFCFQRWKFNICIQKWKQVPLYMQTYS